MQWQDVVFSVGQTLFTLSLIPSIISRDKPSVWTSGVTALLLLVFTYSYYSLNLLGSAAATFLCAGGWTILFIQKIREKGNG